jgi:hypothetical protein
MIFSLPQKNVIQTTRREFTVLNATYSQKLERRLAEVGWEQAELTTITDCTSTSGYDNDGSTGPELVDNGIGLAFACRDYHKDSVIFYAEFNDTVYYQFGLDEDDAMRRFNERVLSKS